MNWDELVLRGVQLMAFLALVFFGWRIASGRQGVIPGPDQDQPHTDVTADLSLAARNSWLGVRVVAGALVGFVLAPLVMSIALTALSAAIGDKEGVMAFVIGLWVLPVSFIIGPVLGAMLAHPRWRRKSLGVLLWSVAFVIVLLHVVMLLTL